MPRPAVAIISNVQTPYRVAMHRRLIREIPEVQFYSVYTHDKADQEWASDAAADTNPVRFGMGDKPSAQATWLAQPREFAKGGKLIAWMRSVGVNAVALGGYNDMGRVRIILDAKARGLPLFLFSDSNFQREKLSGPRHLIKRILVGGMMRMIDTVLVAGSNGHRYFRYYGVPDDRILRFPLDVDYATIASITDDDVAAARQRFDLAPSRKRFVYCGRMEDEKRPDLTVGAFIKVAHQMPEWDLVMIGDGQMAEPLKQSVPAPLKDRIRWLGFLGNQKDIASIYRCCDALVLSSDKEQWGLVLNEAAASGIAVIAADKVGAVPELVQQDRNGMTFATGSQAELESALVAMAQPGCSERMGAASLQVIQEWRAQADPVQGMREALRHHGLLSAAARG